jgi:protoheme IX farnesyltransferase
MSHAVAVAAPHTRVGDLFVLTKARLNALVVFTTAGGYYLASPSPLDGVTMAVTCAGTALVASGAAAMNQVAERNLDSLMTRTRNRPVAGGRMGATAGSVIGLGLTAAGLVMLALASGWLATLVAFATAVIYVAIYTPLKTRTSLATVVGAVPGALPPLIGWAAARGTLAEPLPWALFVIMFLWQLPHFLAIAWMCKDDYALAGMPMLPVIDKGGVLTGQQAVLWAATIIPFSEVPYLLGLTNAVYAIGALVIGILQLACAVRFAHTRTRPNARALFLASIVYLPLLWTLMAIGR